MAEIDYEKLQQSLDEVQKKFGLTDEGLAKFVKTVKGSTTDFKKAISDLNKEIVKGKKGYKDQSDMLEKVSDAIEDLSDEIENETDQVKRLAKEEEKRNLIAKKEALQTSASMRGLSEATSKATTEIGKSLVVGAGKFMRSLQDDSSGIATAAGLMTMGIDMAVAGVQGLGKGAQAVGPMLMRFGPWGMAAGAALSFLGGAAETTAKAAGELAKFFVEFLQKEAEKTFKAFNQMNAAGALFSDGMSGMRKSAHAAGLTVEQYSKVVKDNGDMISKAGLGVTDGAKMIGRVAKGLKDSKVQEQLLKLGYSFEEQAGLIAETAANMRQAAGGTVTDQQIQEQTKKYAENLRFIAAITGEDAKKKMEQMKSANAELMFQQQLAGMSAEQRAEIDAAMLTMTEQEQKNFRERLVFGDVISKEGAIYETLVSGARQKGEEAARLAKQNNLTAQTNAALNVKYGEQIHQSTMANKEFGMAAHVAGGEMSAVGKSMVDANNQYLQYTDKSTKAASKGIKEAANTRDGLTNDLISAEIRNQELKVQLEEELLGILKDFNKAANVILSEMQKQIAKLMSGDVDGSIRKEYEKQYGGLADYRMDLDKQEYERRAKMSDAERAKEDADRKRFYENIHGKNTYQPEKSMYERAMQNKKAKGGPIASGDVALVGEAGPEIVTGPANVVSAEDTKSYLDQLKGRSFGEVVSTGLKSLEQLAGEGEGTIAGYFLKVARELKWKGNPDGSAGVWTVAGEPIDQKSAQEILDFARDWPKLKAEISNELAKAQTMVGAGGKDLDNALKSTGVNPVFAKGGIATGSLSGYSATLHGTEAVVPLPDNKGIPVNLDSSSLTGAIQAQSGILTDILTAMNNNNKLASGILQNSY